MDSIKTWANVIVDGVKSVVLNSPPIRQTLCDSSLDLNDGLDVVELDTVPAELLDFFK